MNLGRVDGQGGRRARRIHSTAVLEVLSSMVDVVCGGQGREDAYGKCGELHREMMF